MPACSRSSTPSSKQKPTTTPLRDFYGRLDLNDPAANAIFELAGDSPPESEFEAMLIQNYLLECILETDDPIARNTALVALAGEAARISGQNDQPLASGPMFPTVPGS